MLKNYLLIALRNIRKNSIYSFINIFGLAVGIASSILILLWVHHETSYDRFHPNIERLHQVYINSYFDGKVNTWNSVPLPTADGLKETEKNIKYAATTDWGGDHLLTVGEKRLNKRGYYASQDYLKMFQFPLLQGAPESALTDPYTIVITESTAKAFFGDEDPINKVIRVDDAHDVKVSAVLKDIPSNSTFTFDYLLTFGLYESQDWVKRNKDNWGNYSWQVFVELDEHTTQAAVEANIKDLLTKKGQNDIKRDFILHPMKNWRLYGNFENGVAAGGLIDYVNIFSLVGIFIVIIACINFMNLATARSEHRAREVGIRKSVGSRRKELVFQFLGESLLIALFAFFLAVGLAELSLPYYNVMLEKQLVIDYTSPVFWTFSLCVILITGILSGSYPAFYLSSFNIVRVLKGKVQIGKSASTPRKVLVVLQFVFSITLIVCSIVIQRQIEHIKARQLGYDQTNLIMVDYTTDLDKNYKVLKQELLAAGVVESVTKSNSPITAIYSNNFMDWPGKPEELKVIFSTIATEYDYTKTTGVKLLQGRDFSEAYPADSSSIIINKAALDLMALEEPLGTQVDLWGGKRTIVGVVDNVLMGSLYRDVSPMFMIFDPEWASVIMVKLSPSEDVQSSLSVVENIFRKHNPAYPFEYRFADVEFTKKFSDINMISGLASFFTILAICITGLGLFGLAAFTAEQRTKELGIRKVLGASVSSLVLLITKEFTLLVTMAFVVSAPLAWWGSNILLEKYPYRIDIPLWVFPVAGLVALTFTLVIVTTQALKAATANPAVSLKNE